MNISTRLTKLENLLAPKELQPDEVATARQRLHDLLSRKIAARPGGAQYEPLTTEAKARVIAGIKRLAQAVSAKLMSERGRRQ